MGILPLEKGLYTDAAEHLKKVSRTRFRYRDLYLSIALRNCGKTKAADEAFRRFLKHNPAPLLASVLPKVGG